MKLYSKRYLFLAVIISAVVIFCLSTFIYNAKLNKKLASLENAISANGSNSIIEEESANQIISQNNIQKSNQARIIDSSEIINVANNANYTQDELQNISVYEQYNEAVVNINTQVMTVNWFLEPIPQNGGTGSGAIIDSRGYVVTNVHVIEDAYKIYVSLADGTQYEGHVVGSDSASDIAVIKFTPPAGMELKTIPYGESESLKVGQKVLAIGNPFGFERTLTTGIVSGLGRPIQNSNGTIIRNMIQTDTAINPGNSGGPLLDSQGKMIGINTMIYSTSGSSAGIGFAVPIDTAKRVIAELIQYGTVNRGTIDAKLVQLTQSIANYANLSVSQGLLVSELSENSNAYKQGLKAGTESVQYGSRFNSTTIYLKGDVILGVDGVSVSTLADYYSVLESKKPGDKVELTILRNNKTQKLKINLD